MNAQPIMEEQELDILDAIGGLIEQWRGMLLVGLIAAVLLAGLKFGMDTLSYRAAMAEQETEEEGTSYADMAETPVMKTLTYYQQWRMKKEYYDNSYLMNLDTTNEHRMYTRYYLKPAEGSTADLDSISSFYTRMIHDTAFLEKMAQALGVEPDERYVRELYSIAASNTEALGAGEKGILLQIMAVLPEKTSYDTEKMTQAMTEYMLAQVPALSKTMGKYEVEFVSSNILALNNQTRAEQQSEAYDAMLAAQSQYDKFYKALSDSDREIVDMVIETGKVDPLLFKIRSGNYEINEEETGEVSAEEIETASEEEAGMPASIVEALTVKSEKAPGLSILFAILGLVAGAAVYAVVYLCRISFIPRIRTEKEIQNLTGIRSFGAVFEYPYRKGLARLFHSRKIYNFRHGVSGKPVQSAAKIAKDVAARAQNLGLSKLSFITLGEDTDWTDMILGKQTALLEKSGITAELHDAPEGIDSMEESDFGKLSPVLIVLLSGVTTPRMVEELLIRLHEYNIPVLGTEFLEGV